MNFGNKRLEVHRKFDYRFGKVNLAFTLQVDEEKELVPFIEILERALVDVKEALQQVRDEKNGVQEKVEEEKDG